MADDVKTGSPAKRTHLPPLRHAPQPYPYQVGGHGMLFQASPGTVMKPLCAKEEKFYSFVYSDKIPPELAWLRAVTPHFHGTRHLPTPISRSPKSPSAPPSPADHAPSRRPPTPPTPPRPPTPLAGLSPHTPQSLHAPETPATPLSPWAEHMALRVGSTSATNTVVVLEDVNFPFRKPCVMDVKIGRRHYDDDATEEKQRRHIEKANSTTTAATGVRFIGVQSFKGSEYDFRDKYHGRTLQEADLIPEARWFFHNGTRLRADCVTLVLLKLRAIAKHMEVQRFFKFYSSSLLIVYEGDASKAALVDVRMIDFAHTQQSSGDRDSGYLFGVRYLISVLEAVLEQNCDSPAGAASSSSDTPTTAPRSVATPVEHKLRPNGEHVSPMTVSAENSSF
jgi:Inositol polyphosphate kinase